jgi:DNA (cytosine-5)-methyltransferase 3A
MSKSWENVITRAIGVKPISINSALVSAQSRPRLYWTNIFNHPEGLFGEMSCKIPQPKDRGILLKHILEKNVPEKYFLSDKMLNYFEKRASNFNNGVVNIREEDEKATCLTASMASCDISDNFIKVDTNLSISPNQDKANCFTAGGNSGGLHSDMTLIVASRGRNPENPKNREIGLNTEQQLEPRFDGKANCLTSVQKDNLVMQLSNFKQDVAIHQDKDKYPCLRADAGGIVKGLGLIIPEATKKGFTEIKPGECFDFENINSKTRRGRKMEEKSNCFMAQETNFMHYTKDFKIRRLTPREVFRLQTFPEPIIDKILNCGVSDSQLYRQAGNGWTVEVIVHILSYMKIAKTVNACPIL